MKYEKIMVSENGIKVGDIYESTNKNKKRYIVNRIFKMHKGDVIEMEMLSDKCSYIGELEVKRKYKKVDNDERNNNM